MTKFLEILIALLEWWQHRGSERLFGSVRSPMWQSVRKTHISLFPNCAVCGKKGTNLSPNEVHHKIPFNIDKSLELDPENLITLCRNHHLLIGHLMSFRSYNIEVETDAEMLLEKITNRP